MSHPVVRNVYLFVFLVLLQVLIFNNVEYWGYVNPMVYIVFILLLPYRENRMPSLVAAFLIGLCIDIFSNTGGLHAASSVLIAYLRNPILLTVFGKNFEYQELDLLAYPFSKILEVFNFNHLFLTLAKIVGASIFTIIVCLLFIYLFSKNKK